MEHADAINKLMPCDKSGDFPAVWVDVEPDVGLRASRHDGAGTFPTTVGFIEGGEVSALIAALEALPEHARPQYLVEAAS